MKLIGVDYGRRRIGLAATDETGSVARGLQTIVQKDHVARNAALAAVIAAEKPGALVFGLPLDADDGETSMSAEVRKFAAEVEQSSGLKVYFIDESLTSKRAAELLLFRRKKERRNKGAVDKIAACLILEAFIKENNNL